MCSIDDGTMGRAELCKEEAEVEVKEEVEDAEEEVEIEEDEEEEVEEEGCSLLLGLWCSSPPI